MCSFCQPGDEEKGSGPFHVTQCDQGHLSVWCVLWAHRAGSLGWSSSCSVGSGSLFWTSIPAASRGCLWADSPGFCTEAHVEWRREEQAIGGQSEPSFVTGSLLVRSFLELPLPFVFLLLGM